MHFFLRLLASAFSVTGLSVGLLAAPSPTFASRSQVAMFQEDVHLLTDPQHTLNTLRELGADVVRVSVHWSQVAPSPLAQRQPAGFNAADPGAYPAANWAPYDSLVRAARADGIAVDLSVTGNPPLWASGPHKPAGGRYPEWQPSAAQYGKFVQAVAKRYSGSYNSLPRVSYWEIWNEPNFGQSLAPQAINGSTISLAPSMYRGLVAAAWGALRATGHSGDTIILGNLDARGQNGRPGRGMPEGLPGNFGATKPMQFVRTLYCVDSAYRQLRGRYAAQVGCPSSAAGSRRFRAANPGLFQATGFADHPYPVNLPPNQASSTDPDYVEFNQLPRFAAALDRLQRIYGSGKHFALYNNEYGYITNPPNHNAPSHFVSPATAAGYLNEAEYMSWRNPRIASTMQYLLYDPNPVQAPEYGGFASGLIFFNGIQKPTYDSYRLPFFLPATSSRRGRSVEVWGCARPASVFGSPQVQIQFQRGSRGAFTTLRTVNVTDGHGYFDLHMAIPATGSLRLAWTYPGATPSGYVDPLATQTVYSRTIKFNVR